MTTALSIISDAYRESNITPAGTTLNATMEAEGFGRLLTLIASALGDDVGSPLSDWPIGNENYQDSMSGWSSSQWAYPRANVRLVLNLGAADTVYMPFQPEDGARVGLVDSGGNLATYPLTLSGNGRSIEDAASITVDSDGLAREWFFRADLGGWVRVTDLADTAAEMPFPKEFDDYWIIRLAMRLNPRFGRSLSDETKARLAEVTAQIQSRYHQRRVIHAEPGALQMNRISYGRSIDPYNPGFGN